MLGSRDHRVSLQTLASWPRVATVVIAAWLTITAFLYLGVMVSHDGSRGAVMEVMDDVQAVYHRDHRLRRTAHDKLLAWAQAHKPIPPPPPPREKAGLVLPEDDLGADNDRDILLSTRRKMTAHEKLQAYARNQKLEEKKTVSSAVAAGHKEPPRPKEGGVTARTQRQIYEAAHPPSDLERIRSYVQSLRPFASALDDGLRQSAHGTLPYDPFDCPETPPPEYPLHYSMVDMLLEWPMDQLQWPTSPNSSSAEDSARGEREMEEEEDDDASHRPQPHPYLYQSLCIFDWDRPDHRERIRRYQVDLDVPFVLRNHPEFLQATERWGQPHTDDSSSSSSYLQALIGDEPQRTEHSFHSNHLLFWRTKGILKSHLPAGWKPPTENVFLSYAEWSQRADAMDAGIDNGQDQTKMDHYYFRLNGQGDEMNPYLYEELAVFDPKRYKEGENLFMLYPDQARGINCRFGMAGNVAESHFDYSSNWIALLGGHRRYILSHPRECGNLALFPPGHPSGRHTSVNWSQIRPGDDRDKASSEAKRSLALAEATQVVLQPSDALFLPTNWMHSIVSLDRNYQCNARSGIQTHYNSYMKDCGFTL